MERKIIPLPAGVDEFNNYCHDPEISEAARTLGITDDELLNRAFSIGESPYGGYDRALDLLDQSAKSPYSLPRSALSKKAKRKIMERYGII